MKNTGTAYSSTTEAKDLLLEDYRYRANMLLESEKAGEMRMNLFTALIPRVPTLAGSADTIAPKRKRRRSGAFTTDSGRDLVSFFSDVLPPYDSSNPRPR